MFKYCCMRGASKAAGLSSLCFCLGIIAGMCMPLAAVAILEMACLLIFGYFCLFKW